MPAGARDCGEVAQEFKKTGRATIERTTGINFINERSLSQAFLGLHGFYSSEAGLCESPMRNNGKASLRLGEDHFVHKNGIVEVSRLIQDSDFDELGA